MLEIRDLGVEIEGKQILKGVDLKVGKGNVHALMGPNGSGKSTLANAVMGNPKHLLTSGKILIDGEDANDLSVDKRAKLGVFMSFQYPAEIEGVTISNFLKTAYNNLHGKKLRALEFRDLLRENLDMLKVPHSFADRYLNQGFSGGEKKKSEILQLAVLKPKLAILDETDSGLDIDALKAVADGINLLKKMNPEMTILIITHYKRILEFINPDKISIMLEGKIAAEGGKEIVDQLEREGYAWLKKD